jgi:hypothetical protein
MRHTEQNDKLQIIGYQTYAFKKDSILMHTSCPRIFRPVLQNKETKELLAHFTIKEFHTEHGGYAWKDTIEDLISDNSIVVFDEPLDIKHSYEIWMNEECRILYEHKDEVQEKLDMISKNYIDEAIKHYKEKEYEESACLSAKAQNSNREEYNAFIVFAASAIKMGRPEEKVINILGRVLNGSHEDKDFRTELKKFIYQHEQ